MTLFSATLTLFLVMDPLGNVPLFASLLQDYDERRQARIVTREHLFALGVLLLALVLGPAMLRWLGIQEPALRIGGGVVLFIIALRMVFPTPEGVFGEATHIGEPLLVPLAVPLIAGPSSVATVMLLASRDPVHRLTWTAATLGAWTGSLLILLAAGYLSRRVGHRVLAAGEKLMGMVLLVVAVQMLLDGLKAGWRT